MHRIFGRELILVVPGRDDRDHGAGVHHLPFFDLLPPKRNWQFRGGADAPILLGQQVKTDKNFIIEIYISASQDELG
jgi:hypothetical protein